MSEIEKQYGGLPSYQAIAIRLFLDARNRLVHGGTDATDDQVIQAIDSGITILRSLQAIPRLANVVAHSNVTVYKDAECQNPYTDIVGVILQQESPGGANRTMMIFPTTRRDFVRGERVSWEWNLNRVTGRAWYRDPADGSAKEAWASAGEFVGRDLDGL